jgi:peptidoglycan/LPS O-acetylase OafA/YrhL
LWGLLVSALVALVTPGIAVGMGFTPSLDGFYGNLFRFFPLIHVPAFVFGALLARVYEEDRAGGTYARWALPLGLVLLGLVVAFNRTWFYFFLHDGALLIPFGLIIYGLAAREGIGGHDRVPKWLILFGDASYGIYILQFPVFAWTFAVIARVMGGKRELVSGWEVLAYAFFLTGVCVLIYRYFELPVRTRIRRLAGTRG